MDVMPSPPSGGESGSLADALRRGPLGAGRLAGALLGAYRIEGEIARGGMGMVLRAVHQPSGTPVALKVLHMGACAKLRDRKRFIREATLARALRHPGIVSVLDAGEVEGLLYIAYELIEGGTLGEAFERRGPRERVELLLGVARGLAAAHSLGIVHRDVKPGNVLVNASDGRPLLTDFGLARDLGFESDLTKTGSLLGTPAYMAPEQIRGKKATPATDVFALGVLLYEALTGERPFCAENLALQYTAMAQRPAAPSSLEPEADAAIDDVCFRALAVDPQDRYPDAGAFADQLEAWLAGELAPPSRSGLFRAGLVGVVSLLAATGLFLFPGEDAGAPGEGSSNAPSVDAAAELREVQSALDPLERFRRLEAFVTKHPEHAGASALLAQSRPWRERQTQPPIPRQRAGIEEGFAYDSRRGRCVFYGGVTYGEGKGVHGDMWSWNGEAWSQIDLSGPTPGVRYGHAMAYDPGRDRLVLFGGKLKNGKKSVFTNEVWEFDGSDWERKKPAQPLPAVRAWAGLVYVPAKRALFLFGGSGQIYSQGQLDDFGDLWSWDGARWIEHRSEPSPSGRHGFGLAYDTQRQRLVLFGGYSEGKATDDLWEHDGAHWSQIPRKGRWPVARMAPAMIFDGERVLSFGGQDRDKNKLSDLWSWDGVQWIEREPAQSPPGRFWHPLVYDLQRGVAVTFGGSTSGGHAQDTWEYPLR
jgi:predicted Ser/Thr protein kinase